MHRQMFKRGERNQVNLLAFTMNDDDNEHSPAAVSHYPGTDAVTIRGGLPREGVVHFKTDEGLTHLRDALIALCTELGLPPATAS